jgi:hypothetical protein
MQKVEYLLPFMLATALVSHFEISELKSYAKKNTAANVCNTNINKRTPKPNQK